VDAAGVGELARGGAVAVDGVDGDPREGAEAVFVGHVARIL
jgi:hypothetical protein